MVRENFSARGRVIDHSNWPGGPFGASYREVASFRLQKRVTTVDISKQKVSYGKAVCSVLLKHTLDVENGQPDDRKG